jgi:hypothetical protein
MNRLFGSFSLFWLFVLFPSFSLFRKPSIRPSPFQSTLAVFYGFHFMWEQCAFQYVSSILYSCVILGLSSYRKFFIVLRSCFPTVQSIASFFQLNFSFIDGCLASLQLPLFPLSIVCCIRKTCRVFRFSTLQFSFVLSLYAFRHLVKSVLLSLDHCQSALCRGKQ